MFQITLILPDGTYNIVKVFYTPRKGEYIIFKHKEFVVISVTHLYSNDRDDYYMHESIIRLKERKLDD